MQWLEVFKGHRACILSLLYCDIVDDESTLAGSSI